MKVENDQLTGHQYDGIEEYDNPTPAWWTWIFALTFVFSIVYVLVMFTTRGEMSPEAFYARDFTDALKAQYGQLAGAQPDEATLLKLARDEKWNGVGKSIFETNCVSCHGTDASGVAAPNLTDEAFLHIKKVEDIHDVIANGRKNGAMPAWNQRLQPVEQILVSSYVASLRGQNRPSLGNRPAEGAAIAPWAEK